MLKEIKKVMLGSMFGSRLYYNDWGRTKNVEVNEICKPNPSVGVGGEEGSGAMSEQYLL